MQQGEGWGAMGSANKESAPGPARAACGSGFGSSCSHFLLPTSLPRWSCLSCTEPGPNVARAPDHTAGTRTRLRLVPLVPIHGQSFLPAGSISRQPAQLSPDSSRVSPAGRRSQLPGWEAETPRKAQHDDWESPEGSGRLCPRLPGEGPPRGSWHCAPRRTQELWGQ